VACRGVDTEHTGAPGHYEYPSQAGVCPYTHNVVDIGVVMGILTPMTNTTTACPYGCSQFLTVDSKCSACLAEKKVKKDCLRRDHVDPQVSAEMAKVLRKLVKASGYKAAKLPEALEYELAEILGSDKGWLLFQNRQVFCDVGINRVWVA
jgi:hypothetical protein